MRSLAETHKIVAGGTPVTTNGGVTADYVSLKNVQMCHVIVSLTQAVGHATAITLEKATAVAPTGSTAITTSVPIWANEDCDTSDTLTRQTDAVSHTVGAAAKDMLVVFQVDPATLGATYDCLTCKLADSSQATNFASVTYVLESRYPSANPPAAITD